jgi:hypothetical protein
MKQLVFGFAFFLIVWQLWSILLKWDFAFSDPGSYSKQNKGNDYVTKYGERFKEVKSFFSKPSRVGYCSELNQDKPTFYMHYTLTQYYLAPNIITTNINEDTILYNLYETFQLNESTNFHLNNGWRVIKNFNNGFIILAK